MQDGEESDLGAEAPGIGGHFEQGLGAGVEQQVEQWPGCSERQRVQFVGHGEDEMEVAGVEQVALLGFEPSLAGMCLALRTTTRGAGVVGDECFVLTAETLILMAAESRGTATQHSPICLQLLIAETGPVAFQELPTLCADDVGHFNGRLRHGRRGR